VGPMEAIMSGVMAIFSYGMITAMLWKVFQVSKDVSEIKVLLKDLRNPAPAAKPISPPVAAAVPPPVMAGPISLESAEALLREVEAESHALASEPTRK
jgi:hypothetical protein